MNRQKEIIRILYTRETMTLNELLQAVPFGYYHNGEKHLGAMMSRMVANGTVKRIKPGVFTLNPSRMKLESPVPENQLEIFTTKPKTRHRK